MVTRIYVDNYKCLVNFEYQPGRLQLLLGPNGAGKTTVFVVLSALRSFLVDGDATIDAFPKATLTTWQSTRTQRFEVDVAGNGGAYSYRLQIEHEPDRDRNRVAAEELLFGGAPLFRFVGGEVSLFRDDGSAGPKFSLDWSRSGLATVPERHDNTRLIWFKDWIRGLARVQINPWAIAPTADREDSYPRPDMSNFVAWYRHLVQERPEVVEEVRDALAEVLDGFVSLRLLRESASTRGLRARFRVGPTRDSGADYVEWEIPELSEGQRALIALYAVLHASLADGAILLVDEPDNFVALREIQPWLLALEDRVEECGAQVLLVSHHPEVINFLAPDRSVLLQRDGIGPTRVQPFANEASRLLPAELVARGWEGE